MTDRDREQYLEVLFALAGHGYSEYNNDKKDKEEATLPVNLPVKSANPFKYWGFTI